MNKDIEKMFILREHLLKIVAEITALKNFFEKNAKESKFDYSLLINECEIDIAKYNESVEPINDLIKHNDKINKAFYQRYGA